ncbi:thiamine-phosphate kinase [Halovivax sp.]|uniref:thiamine-phosphate kinase n=1 Tax=Halovivax sp. TaxID=1935978 RepID=UPI0025BCF90D|nr:thiamine-phosphate kinase [Halovivax sp.]
MDERAALSLLADELAPAGDDAAVVDGRVLTTDMLHETTDFPDGTTRYTAGWRAVGASLSDVAAMGAEATAAVAVYAAPAFDADELLAFVRGAREVCELTGARYVGGDLDEHREFTVATTALGRTDDPVRRSGARPGDRVCVTGTLGRSAAALELFERGDRDRANDLFRFEPRVAAGRAIAPHATAMMDSSDGLARSLHQLAEASGCGFAIESDRVPVADPLAAVSTDADAALDSALTFGEDFELVFSAPADAVGDVRTDAPVDVFELGEVVADGVTVDGEPLADEGYSHG